MTSPSSEDPTSPQPGGAAGESSSAPPPPEQPFDPYRFGAPDTPPPPEYAPPGYVPPPPPPTPPAQPPPYGAYTPYPGSQPGPAYGPPGQFGPPGSPYPPGPYLNQYPQPPRGNGRATAGMILGIVSIVLFFFSILDAIPVILGFIFAGLGLGDSRRNGSGRSRAIAGMICAGIGAVFAIVWTVVILTRLHPCMSLNRGSSAFNSCVRNRL